MGDSSATILSSRDATTQTVLHTQDGWELCSGDGFRAKLVRRLSPHLDGTSRKHAAIVQLGPHRLGAIEDAKDTNLERALLQHPAGMNRINTYSYKDVPAGVDLAMVSFSSLLVWCMGLADV